jgi:hypothetical protein
MSNQELHSHQAPVATPMLWLAFFMPPVVWAFHLQFVYAAAQQVCNDNLTLTSLHAFSAACTIVALIALFLAVWQLLSTGGRFPSDERGDVLARRRFLAAEALLSGLLFSIVIVAQWLALLYLSPCAP